MLIYTVVEEVQEIQPWGRNTATTSQSHHEKEAGPGVWWGCGPVQLAAPVPCASVYSGTLNTPGAPVGVLELYIKIISYYIEIAI